MFILQVPAKTESHSSSASSYLLTEREHDERQRRTEQCFPKEAHSLVGKENVTNTTSITSRLWWEASETGGDLQRQGTGSRQGGG